MASNSLSELIREANVSDYGINGRPIMIGGEGPPDDVFHRGWIYLRTGRFSSDFQRIYLWDDGAQTWVAMGTTSEMPDPNARDDRPMFFVTCDGTNFIQHPNYRTALGGGYAAQFATLRDLCLTAASGFSNRIQFNLPKGRAGKLGNIMNPSLAVDPLYGAGANPYFGYPYADGTVITPGNSGISGTDPPTFNINPYGVDAVDYSTLDPATNHSYLNTLYANVIAAVLAVDPDASFSMHDGLWGGESMTQIASSRAFSAATDLAAYLADQQSYKDIGITERYIDAGAVNEADGGVYELVETIRTSAVQRMGLEGIPTIQHAGPTYTLDLDKILLYPSWAAASTIMADGSFWDQGFDTLVAPQFPYNECIVILIGNSGHSDAETIARAQSLYQRGFILGADGDTNVSMTNVDIALAAMA